MRRCQSALEQNRKSCQDRTLKLSFREKPTREKGHWGTGGRKGGAWGQDTVELPFPSAQSPQAGYQEHAHPMGSCVGLGVKRAADGLIHDFLSNRLQKDRSLDLHISELVSVFILDTFARGEQGFI